MTEERAPYSEDWLELVLAQLRRRRLFRLALAILALFYGAAIFAPLIASDRPWLLEAVDLRGYRSALRLLSPIAGQVERLVATSPGDYLATRGPNAGPTRAAALEAELRAAGQQVALLERYLEPVDAERPRALLAELERAARAAGEGRTSSAREIAVAARAEARALAAEWAPRAPDAPADAPGKRLLPHRSFPLLASLSAGEVYFMALWLLLVARPLWSRLVDRRLLGGDRERARQWRGRKLAALVLLPALVAAAWALFAGADGGAFDGAAYKAGLSRGDIVARRALFPPLALGYSETNLAESFRPPTWLAAAEMDAEGRYLRGARRPAGEGLHGPAPEPAPVEVRWAEPALNAPLRHPAGADELGRDLLVRMIWGARVSLSVGLLSAALLTLVGVVLGAAAGYAGGWVDVLLMRAVEVLQSIPALFLVLVVMAFHDPEVVHPLLAIVAVIALVRWTGAARLVRGEFLRLREQEYVLAARALGYSGARTLFRHLLPNATGPVLVHATFAVAAGILTESAISFLGFGIRPPEASWGSLVSSSRNPEHWWIQLFPGLLIFVTVTCYNLVGDAVRDALDPKLRE